MRASNGRSPPRPVFREQFRRSRRGVSEVIGTILILSLTVVLFAAIFYFVSTLPPPAASSTSSFQAVLGIGGGTNPYESYINISYQAGPTLSTASVQIYLTSSEHPSNFGCARTGTYGDPYTLAQGLGGASLWNAGTTWSLHLAPLVTTCSAAPGALTAAGDNVTISIVNTANNVLLFHVVLPGTPPNIPPIFLNYGVSQPGQGGTTQNYTIYTSIRSSDLNFNSVFVNLASVPGAPGAPQKMGYNGVTGQWSLTILGGTTNPICCTPYTFIINATDNGTGVPHPQHNSVALTYTFPSNANTASLLIQLSLSVGNPTVGESVVLTASVGDNGGASASLVTVTFTSSATGPIGGPTVFPTVSAGTPVPNPTYDAQVHWKAGPHSGSVNLTASATSVSGSTATTTLTVTVFPRTLVIDESGVALGLNASQDTFTYLETDLSSADVPFNSTIVVPGSSVIGWDCAAPTCLNNYDVIIWLLSNTGYLSASDIQALNCATGTGLIPACGNLAAGDRSVWLLGASSLNGTNALYTNFGISAVTFNTFYNAEPQIQPAGATLPNFGEYANNMYLNGNLAGNWNSNFGHYDTITTLASGNPVFQTTVGAHTIAEAVNSTYHTLVMPFELSTLSITMPWGSGNYVTSLSQQSSVVYNAFNWLANFTSLSPHRNGNDWAVSEVDIQPPTLTFNSPAYVNFTVRNNGPTTSAITVEVLVDNLPLFIDGTPVTTQLTPGPEGGLARATFNWTPSFVGYLSVGIEILPPPSDLDAANNIMENSLFATQLYVHYNVLIVDATTNTGVHHETTPYIYNALIADGYPSSTITEVSLASGCGNLPTVTANALTNSPPRYNLVVWNIGDTTNTSGCPLSNQNMHTITTFLDNGGPSSSLLFIGNGLLTDGSNGPISNFAGTFLGIKLAPVVATTPNGDHVYGQTGDEVGDGVSLPYPAGSGVGNDTFSVLNNTPEEVNSFSLYENDPDFWTIPTTPAAVGADAWSSAAGWHTAYWGFNVATVNGQVGGTSALDVALLRFSTFAGRLLPEANAIVSAPDITFATAQQPWTNFDQMHPQLEQQYLIRANVTNLGGASAFSVQIEVYDGSHILGSNSVTVAASFTVPGGETTISSGTISVAWTPLYGANNPIRVVIVSSGTASILPGVSQSGQWNVTVYFFYDTTTTNQNSWTHSQEALVQTNVDPQTCYQQPGGDAFLWANINNPQEWPGFSTASCAPGSASDTADTWGEVKGTCFVTNPYCASLGIGDSGANANSVEWAFSSAITLPAAASSITATWWQEYNLAPSASGGLACVEPQGTTFTSGGAGNTAEFNSISTCLGEAPPSPTYTSPAAPAVDYGGTCYFQPSFSGASEGGTGGWQQESLNLTAYVGTTVHIAFGYIEGDTACGGTFTAETGWNIDDFQVSISGGPANPAALTQTYSTCATQGANIPSDLWQLEPASALSATLTGMGLATNSVPTGGAWVNGAWSGGTLTLDPNVWDSLYSRPIDLSDALSATINFNYAWADVFWADGGGYTPPYFYPQGPQQDFILEVAPAGITTSVTPWIEVWSADSWSATVYNGADAHLLGTLVGSHSWTGSIQVMEMGWHAVSISLNAYAGQVIQLRFLVGTNCGAYPGTGPDEFNYPMNDGAVVSSASLLSGINITGPTTISAGVGAGQDATGTFGSPAGVVATFGTSVGTPPRFVPSSAAAAAPSSSGASGSSAIAVDPVALSESSVPSSGIAPTAAVWTPSPSREL